MQYHHRDRSNPSHPAGDSRKLPLRVDFDRRLKLEFLGSKITSDAGLLAYRELDDVLGLTDLAGAALSDLRRGKNTRHLLTGLLRQSVFGRLAGYEDVNDAERLSRDPAMRAIVDRKGLDRRAASTSQMGRFETEWLATDDNLAGLTAIGFWMFEDARHGQRSPTHTEGYNGHFVNVQPVRDRATVSALARCWSRSAMDEPSWIALMGKRSWPSVQRAAS